MSTTVAPSPPAAAGATTDTVISPAPAGGRRRPGIGLHILLGLGLLLVMAPFIWMVLGSFKTSAELRRVPPTWWPSDPTLENFRELFTRLDFPRYFFNSSTTDGTTWKRSPTMP